MFQPSKFGNYYLYERIAVGGMAEIYKAKMYGVDGFEKNMVVKQILPQYARNKEFIQMFIDEAKICVTLSHGNIVPVYELGQIDGIYFISMEHVDGKNLGELLDASIEDDKPLAVPHALFIASEILAGLDYAHRKTNNKGELQGIVHRDVSPQNILVSFEGEVKIVDFGIASAATKVHATEAGVIKGKFGYMSPEQALGKEVDARSDVFTAGILLYEMITLERLFAGGTEVNTLERVKRADVPTPSRTNPNLPPQLDGIVFKALARKQSDRYHSAGEMRLALSRFLYQLPEEASSKTLSMYIKDLYAEELLKRREQPEVVVPLDESVPKTQPPGTHDMPPPPVGPVPQARAGLDALFGSGGEPIVMPQQGLPAGEPINPVFTEEIADDFSYVKAGRKMKWIVIGCIILLLVVAMLFLRKPLATFFSTFSEAMDKSAEKLAQKDLGTLYVRSRPSGAAVYFGNRRVGQTNMRIGSIDPSHEYELVLTLEGYSPWSRSIMPSDWKQSDKMEIQVYKDWTTDRIR
jgi:serine/threonine protein kinase